jgi:hypothetical protein
MRVALVGVFVAAGCLGGAVGYGAGQRGGAPAAVDVTSPDFPLGGVIPTQFTCEGTDISPALAWNDPPGATRSVALVADDPDAPGGRWVHWVLFDVPAGVRTLARNVPKDRRLANGARQGRNDFGRIGYGGPCPPPGQTHRYFFRIYALDTRLSLEPGATAGEVERATKGHVLAEGYWMGRYARR